MADSIQPSSSDSENTGSRLVQPVVSYYVPVGESCRGERVEGSEDKQNMAWLEDADGKTPSRITLKVLILILAGSLAMISTLAVLLKSQQNADDLAPPFPTVVGNDHIANGPPVFTQPPREIANAFLASTDPKERLQWVRNPKDVAKRMNLYPEEALSHPVKKLIPLASTSVQGMVCARFVARFPQSTDRLLCVLATDDGPKIDWDAYARFSSASWDTILRGTAGPAEVRVCLKPGYYFTYNYHDDAVWQCYRVISPDTQETIYVYARADSKRGELLASVIPEGSSQLQQMTLTISSSDDGHKHGQFNIDRIHTIGWVRGDQDIEDVWTPSLFKGH